MENHDVLFQGWFLLPKGHQWWHCESDVFQAGDYTSAVNEPIDDMMKLLTTFSLALLATLNAQAQGLIWSADGWSDRSSTPGVSWQIAFDHASDPFSGPPPSLNPLTGIFLMTIATNDVGRTFFANAMNEPRFSGFVGGLTDGANGYLRFQDGDTGSWRGQCVQSVLGRPLASPDLAGYNITQIGFRVNNFQDGYDPEFNIYTRRLDYSLDFYVTPVPEPSTWALLALGGATALLLRRNARRRG